MLLFQESPLFDAEIAWNFFRDPLHGGEDFWIQRALPFHEALQNLGQNQNPQVALVDYVTQTYQSNAPSLRAREKEIQKLIKQHLPSFFQQTDLLFPDHPWPRDSFTIIYSLFNFCPRFLDIGSFQIFLADKDEDILFTTFHELLHFIFYDFVKKTFPEFQHKDTESGTFWILAELFNTIIQHTPAFMDVHRDIGETTYLDLLPLITPAQNAWNGNVQTWVVDMITILQKEKRP